MKFDCRKNIASMILCNKLYDLLLSRMVCLLISAPIKHEPSHKYYYDYINLLAKKINIDYNKEEVVDDWIYEYGIFYRII